MTSILIPLLTCQVASQLVDHSSALACRGTRYEADLHYKPLRTMTDLVRSSFLIRAGRTAHRSGLRVRGALPNRGSWVR